MKCENDFCIYQSSGVCILDDISLDITGSCTSAILVNLPENTLTLLKNEALNNYEN